MEEHCYKREKLKRNLCMLFMKGFKQNLIGIGSLIKNPVNKEIL